MGSALYKSGLICSWKRWRYWPGTLSLLALFFRTNLSYVIFRNCWIFLCIFLILGLHLWGHNKHHDDRAGGLQDQDLAQMDKDGLPPAADDQPELRQLSGTEREERRDISRSTSHSVTLKSMGSSSNRMSWAPPAPWCRPTPGHKFGRVSRDPWRLGCVSLPLWLWGCGRVSLPTFLMWWLAPAPECQPELGQLTDTMREERDKAFIFMKKKVQTECLCWEERV